MKESDQRLFSEWDRANKLAHEAEFVAAHPGSRGEATHPALVTTARDLRLTADGLFKELLLRKAFGELRPMP
jgi:hypothetical protein